MDAAINACRYPSSNASSRILLHQLHVPAEPAVRVFLAIEDHKNLNRLVFLADSDHGIQDGLWLRWSIL